MNNPEDVKAAGFVTLPCNSSMISNVQISTESRVKMRLEFARGGKVFEYEIDAGTLLAMWQSDSIGKFFHANIKNSYDATEVTTTTTKESTNG